MPLNTGLGPGCNKILSAAMDRQKMEKHRKRLQKVKPSVDTSAPPIYAHLIHRAKKEQLLEERYTQIENENRILLKKMSHIMRHQSLDNRNFARPRSLNAISRKQELRKIMEENQQILKRIQGRQPNYKREKWVQHSMNHDEYLDNIRDKPVYNILDKTMPREQLAAPPRRRVHKLKQLEDRRAVPDSTQQSVVLFDDLASLSTGDLQLVVEEITAPKSNASLVFSSDKLKSTSVLMRHLKAIVADVSLFQSDRRADLINHLLPRLTVQKKALFFDSSAQDENRAEEAKRMREEAEQYLAEEEQKTESN